MCPRACAARSAAPRTLRNSRPTCTPLTLPRPRPATPSPRSWSRTAGRRQVVPHPVQRYLPGPAQGGRAVRHGRGAAVRGQTSRCCAASLVGRCGGQRMAEWAVCHRRGAAVQRRQCSGREEGGAWAQVRPEWAPSPATLHGEQRHTACLSATHRFLPRSLSSWTWTRSSAMGTAHCWRRRTVAAAARRRRPAPLPAAGTASAAAAPRRAWWRAAGQQRLRDSKAGQRPPNSSLTPLHDPTCFLCTLLTAADHRSAPRASPAA